MPPVHNRRMEENGTSFRVATSKSGEKRPVGRRTRFGGGRRMDEVSDWQGKVMKLGH